MNTSNSAAARILAPGTAIVAVAQRIPINLLRWIMVLLRPPRVRLPQWPPSFGLATALTIAAILASMFFLDTVASDWARHLPPQLTEAADQTSNFALSGWFLYPLGIVLRLCGDDDAVAAAASARHTGGARGALRLPLCGDRFARAVCHHHQTPDRARPAYVGVQDDPFAYMPFIWRPEYASLPSGHAVTATAAAFAIGAVWPRSRVVMWLYAVIIMFARVALNVHHPSDVIAGAFVGIVGALLVRNFFAARRLVFSPADLAAYPWPSFKRIRTTALSVLRS